ncbi:hypothetical protein JXA05_01770 [Candidatus Peregrinibacteria bacterium]|nr:hypothetical protein [Candidatus Peregrinibacteria bacterium]
MNKKNLIIGLLLVAALGGFLKKDFLFEQGKKMLFGPQKFQENTLSIVLNTPETGLSPFSVNLNDALRTANIYQGLVAFDKNLKIVPSLAVSWGNLDPLTWEFKLRQGVFFHDRSPFTAQNVIASFNEARETAGSEVAGYLKGIREIQALGDHYLKIITEKQDPLLLSKLARFMVGRPGNIGTGPYKVLNWEKGARLTLTAFAEYWGKQPAYKNVEYAVMANKTQRKTDFENGKTDILVAVPRDQALDLPREQLKTSYSLEVNFLMFNLQDPLMARREIREAVRTIFDPARIEEIGNFFVRQATQFVAPGVYGYNPDIPPFEFNEEERADALFGNRLEKLGFDYLETYRTLAEYLGQQLRKAGFSIALHALTPEALISKIKSGDSTLFLIGWQAEDGDAGGFLDAFIHSAGEFNNGRYTNPDVDKMIEESRVEMDPKKRLKLLQEIMLKVDDDLIGIPLFESSRLYAVKKNIEWEPRLDGLVLASEVK